MSATLPSSSHATNRTARTEIVRRDEGTGARLDGAHDGRAQMAVLVEAGQLVDAIRFLAHWLPTREGIWWAWSCARRIAVSAPPAEHDAALRATARWIRLPTEEHRRPMLDIAEQAGLSSPAGCAALAAFFSGGSIAPPDAPPVAPPRDAAAQMVAGSVILAGVVTEPERVPEKYRSFIEQGQMIADRLKLSERRP